MVAELLFHDSILEGAPVLCMSGLQVQMARSLMHAAGAARCYTMQVRLRWMQFEGGKVEEYIEGGMGWFPAVAMQAGMLPPDSHANILPASP